ncbi:HNH endonuclease signature motif containing protein [Pontibacillus salipaludis]|uniref:Putative HNH nuclease YajD n=1 Tax=Pontibacillus salipaludis TaxID=1697394 RepID=A0ABQ1PVQ9_9BACI|nr:HNH endonuclease signature motif containing protein [Pontibacillus salipaludis]GGD05334.1 HNH endonuclease [Pontibacillus salipaludis]
MDLQRIKELIARNKLVKFYQSKVWRALRLKVLERDNYECQACKRKGKVGPGQNVHHLKEVKQFPSLALVKSNCEAICIPCHNEEHDRLKKFKKPQPKFVNEERW